MMSYRIGRALQVVGMSCLPIALYLGLVRDEVRREVTLLFIGGAVFLLGWILSQRRS